MPSTHGEWAVQCDVPENASGAGPWTCHLAVRVHGTAKTGTVFTFGLYDKSSNRMVAQSSAEMESATGDDFHIYTLNAPTLSPEMYFWVAPASLGRDCAVDRRGSDLSHQGKREMTRWLAVILACCAIARADLPRIAIDGTQFVRADNHEVFHPWGFNLTTIMTIRN